MDASKNDLNWINKKDYIIYVQTLSKLIALHICLFWIFVVCLIDLVNQRKAFSIWVYFKALLFSHQSLIYHWCQYDNGYNRTLESMENRQINVIICKKPFCHVWKYPSGNEMVKLIFILKLRTCQMFLMEQLFPNYSCSV